MEKASSQAAKKITERIMRKAKILTAFPEAGRRVPGEKNPNIRELIEGPYRIIYKIVSPEEIHIMKVVHSSQQYQPLED